MLKERNIGLCDELPARWYSIQCTIRLSDESKVASAYVYVFSLLVVEQLRTKIRALDDERTSSP